MFKFSYDTASFEQVFQLPEGSLFASDCIIDVEIMNDISPRWIYSEGKPCVVGVLHENRMTVFVAEKESEKEFIDAVFGFLQEKALATTLYAFNCDFDRGVLTKLFDGFEFPIIELAPIKGAGWSKDGCYRALREHGALRDDKEVFDNYGGDAKKAIADFAGWLADGDHQHLMNIVHHNLNCLCKESLIHNHRDWFAEHYKLDKGGFDVGGKHG